jgi:hypothetical protein
MPDSYEGPVRILGSDGTLLTTGSAALARDDETGSWRGVLQTLRGTAVAGKALVVFLETPDGLQGRAQLIPDGVIDDKASSQVAGLSEPPF